MADAGLVPETQFVAAVEASERQETPSAGVLLARTEAVSAERIGALLQAVVPKATDLFGVAEVDGHIVIGTERFRSRIAGSRERVDGGGREDLKAALGAIDASADLWMAVWLPGLPGGA